MNIHVNIFMNIYIGKMTTPSRKLRYTAEASLTVIPSERGGGTKTPYFNVL